MTSIYLPINVFQNTLLFCNDPIQDKSHYHKKQFIKRFNKIINAIKYKQLYYGEKPYIPPNMIRFYLSTNGKFFK
jgi:hypothetical protein